MKPYLSASKSSILSILLLVFGIHAVAISYHVDDTFQKLLAASIAGILIGIYCGIRK